MADSGNSSFGSTSISDVLTTLKQLVQATNAEVDGFNAQVPHYSSGQLIASKLIQSGFVRVTGISIMSAAAGGLLCDAISLAAASGANAVYPLTATVGFFPVQMVFANGLVFLPASAQAATIFYALT